MQTRSFTLIVSLIVVPLVCWAWIVVMARDMYGPMSGASAWTMAQRRSRLLPNGRRTWNLLRRMLLGADAAAIRGRRHEPGGHCRAHSTRSIRKAGAVRRPECACERGVAHRAGGVDARALIRRR